MEQLANELFFTELYIGVAREVFCGVSDRSPACMIATECLEGVYQPDIISMCVSLRSVGQSLFDFSLLANQYVSD